MAALIEAITKPLHIASDLVQGIKQFAEVRDQIKLGELQIALHAQISAALHGAIAAQQNELVMAEEIRGLKEQIMKLEAWEAEKQRYELIQLYPGCVAYRVKESVRGAQAFHLLCANCFERGQKSYLKQTSNGPNFWENACNVCGEKLRRSSDVPQRLRHQSDFDPFTGK